MMQRPAITAASHAADRGAIFLGNLPVASAGGDSARGSKMALEGCSDALHINGRKAPVVFSLVHCWADKAALPLRH